MRRVIFLARAEVLHIVRDRITLMQILVVPLVQLLVLVNAATFVIRDTPVYIVDQDRSVTSRELIRRFAASGFFDVVGYSASPGAADARLLDGSATMIVQVPPDFERSLVREGRAPVHLVVSGEKGSAAGIVQSYAARIVAAHSASLGAELRPSVRTIRAPGDAPPATGVPRVEVRTRGWYNPQLDYTHYMVPGILVALVTIIGTLLAAQNIAREKELGTLEQLNVTPIRRSEFIAAKLLPLWILGLIDLALGLGVGKLVFDVPIRGSVLLLFGAAAVYLLAALAIGLLISTAVDTQQQAMFVAFFIMNVYLLLSGLFTPIESMAPWVQHLSQLNPVRHFVTIARAVLVKGAGVSEIVQPFAMLAGFAVVLLTLSVRRYRKQTA